MHRSLKAGAAVLTLLPGAVVIAAAAGASASDLSLPPLYQPEAAPLVELGSGWYLRGDLGYVNMSLPGPGVPPLVDGQHATASNAALFSPSTTRETLLGTTLGVGYQFDHVFRMDATYDWRQNISRNTRIFRPCGIDQTIYGVPTYRPEGGDCYTNDTVTTQSWTGLVNLYADLGSWARLTPYIGAGLGLSHLQTSARENWFWASGDAYGIGANTYQSNSANAPGYYHFGYPANKGPTQTNNNFSWALMAGVSYDVAPHVKLDIGYRYLNMGSVTTVNAAGQCAQIAIQSQEIRAGLRFTPDL